MAQKQELWQQLGYDSFRDWRLADAKQRRATARKENRSPSCADSDQQPGNTTICRTIVSDLWFGRTQISPAASLSAAGRVSSALRAPCARARSLHTAVRIMRASDSFAHACAADRGSRSVQALVATERLMLDEPVNPLLAAL